MRQPHSNPTYQNYQEMVACEGGKYRPSNGPNGESFAGPLECIDCEMTAGCSACDASTGNCTACSSANMEVSGKGCVACAAGYYTATNSYECFPHCECSGYTVSYNSNTELARCVVLQGEGEEKIIEDLTKDFVANGFNMKNLFKQTAVACVIN